MREPKKYSEHERNGGAYFMRSKLRTRESEGVLYFTRKDWPIVYDFPEAIESNRFFNNLIDKGVAYDAAEIIEKEVNRICNSLVRAWGCKMWSSGERMLRREEFEAPQYWTFGIPRGGARTVVSSGDYRISAPEYVTTEQLDSVRLNIENQIQAASRGWVDAHSDVAPQNRNVIAVTRGEYNGLTMRNELRNDTTYVIVGD